MVLPLIKPSRGYLRLSYIGEVGVSGDDVQQSWDLTAFPEFVRADPMFKGSLVLFAKGAITALSAVDFLPANETPNTLVLTLSAAADTDEIDLDVWCLFSAIGGLLDGPRFYLMGGGGSGGGASGVYTPVLTFNVNIADALVLGTHKWSQVGNIITVAGQLAVDPTAGGVQTDISISLPVPIPAFLDNFQAQGVGVVHGTGPETTSIDIQMQNAPGGKVALDATVPDGVQRAWKYMFQYTLV